MVGKIYPLTVRVNRLVNSWWNKLKNLKQFPPKNHQTCSKTENSMQKKHQQHMFFRISMDMQKRSQIKTEAHHPNLHVDDSQHHLPPGGMYWNHWTGGISQFPNYKFDCVCIYMCVCIDWIVLHIINYIIRILCIHTFSIDWFKHIYIYI